MRFAVPALSLAAFILPGTMTPVVPSPPPDTTMSALFRFSDAVAVADDQILVGRPGRSARQGAPMGGVHVFQRNQAGQWTETAVLASPNVTANEQFGAALAVDGGLLAVGAPAAEDGRGAIYLFERDSNKGRWRFRIKLLAVAGVPNDSLGHAVALHDGVLLAGAPAHAGQRGMAIVFRQGADTMAWIHDATLPAPDTIDRHCFGRTLAITDSRLFIGAPGCETGKALQGQVVVFHDAGRNWAEETRITHTSDSAVSGLGAALAAEDAALWVSSSGSATTVYEFHRDSANRWTEAAAVHPVASRQQRSFGQAIVRNGRDLIVSQPLQKTVYVFRSDSSRAPWTETQRLKTTSARFGETLAAGGNFLVVGVGGRGSRDGTATIYRRDPAAGSWRQTDTIADTAWTMRQPLVGRAIPCDRGTIHRLLDCRNVELLAFLPKQEIGGGTYQSSDIWGWTDITTGREFAILIHAGGTGFVEVTDPLHPKYLGKLPASTTINDVKVYQNYAFIGGDGLRGIQIFDLTQLRNVKEAPVLFKETAHYDGNQGAHNVVVDTVTGFLYAVGRTADRCGGGLHMIDVRDPLHPRFAGCYTERRVGRSPGWIHDAQCVVYHGPDRQYQGREICLSASGNAVTIADITDKRQVKTISIATYPNVRLAHQGWLSEDHRYFFLGDEWDERQDGENTRIIVFNLRDLDDPVVAKEFFGTTTATDHNLYVRGSYAFLSNYRAGLRVLDISDPVNPKEVAYLDTTPHDRNETDYAGTFSNYPFFKNGTIAVANMHEGLFLIRVMP